MIPSAVNQSPTGPASGPRQIPLLRQTIPQLRCLHGIELQNSLAPSGGRLVLQNQRTISESRDTPQGLAKVRDHPLQVIVRQLDVPRVVIIAVAKEDRILFTHFSFTSISTEF